MSCLEAKDLGPRVLAEQTCTSGGRHAFQISALGPEGQSVTLEKGPRMVPGMPLHHTGWPEADGELPPLGAEEPGQTTLLPQTSLFPRIAAQVPHQSFIFQLSPAYQDVSVCSQSVCRGDEDREHGDPESWGGAGRRHQSGPRGAKGRSTQLPAAQAASSGPGGLRSLYLTRF